MFCNNCGAKLEDGSMLCPNCGTVAVPDNTEGDDNSSKTVLLSEEQVNMEINGTDGTNQGSVDGKRIETVEISPTGLVENRTAMAVPNEVEQKKFCPNCGAENKSSDLFCQQCGMFFGNAEAKMGYGDAGAGKRKAGTKKLVALIICLLLVIGFGITFALRIAGGSGTKGQDFIIYLKDNELTMARANKYEPIVIGDKMFSDKDEISNSYNYAYNLITYSPDYKYVYYPQKSDSNGCDLYRRKVGSKKAEAEKIDSQITEYIVIDNDKLVYIKDGYDRKLYLYYKGESEKIDSGVWNMQVSDDGKHVLWMADGKLYVQDINLKSDKVKLDTDITCIYDVSANFDAIVYRKDDNLYVMKRMEEKEKIASDIYDAYVYDIDHSLKIYYLREGDEDNLNCYDMITDDCLSQDQQIQEPRIEDYQRITYKDSFWGMQEKVEVDDSYYEEADKYQQKQNRDYLRMNLESNTIGLAKWEFYYYDDATGASEKVLTATMQPENMGMVAYGSIGTNTALMYVGDTDIESINKPKLSDLADMDYYEIEQQITDSMKDGNQLLYLENGVVREITDYEGECYYLSGWTNEEKHLIYLWDYADGNTALYRFNYGKKDASLELITDELSYIVDHAMGAPYGGADEVCYVSEDGELYYGEEMIAEDIGTVTVWENGSILYLTDMDSDGEEGTLYLYQGGKSTEIADDVAAGRYGIFDDDKVIFLTDYNYKKYRGDLNVYDGKKIKKIDTDVTGFILD